eukprot:TRINITY_DN5754_c0_g1_i1.p1 TRINITY_DN5754_c0_g1~~TRINITY_DN5754_c0_g1_i1.p1  ORF type:complete len:177 (+),score=34.91 TRINITY_DN5754_c0_g1_i1:60-533(+)
MCIRDSNQIADEIERRVDGFRSFNIPCYLLGFSVLCFVVFIGGIVYLFTGNSIDIRIMFLPLILFLILIILAAFWGVWATSKVNAKIREYLEELNNTSLSPRGMVASAFPNGMVRFTVAAGQYVPVNIPQSYFPGNNTYQAPLIVPGSRQISNHYCY